LSKPDRYPSSSDEISHQAIKQHQSEVRQPFMLYATGPFTRKLTAWIDTKHVSWRSWMVLSETG